MILLIVVVLSVVSGLSAFQILPLRQVRASSFLIKCVEEGKKPPNLMDDDKFKTFDMTSKSKPEGYANPDFKKIAEEQKSRVLAYIVLALVPVLFLVPFFLSRDFEPAVM